MDSDDEYEGVPLASLAKPPAGPANEAAVDAGPASAGDDDSAGSESMSVSVSDAEGDGGGGDDAGSGAGRVLRFARIPQSERCGRCDHCLNPQKRKPCIPARERQAAAMRATGVDPFALGSAPRPPPAQQPPAKKRRLNDQAAPSGGSSGGRRSSEDFTAALEPLVNRQGSVVAGKGAAFVGLMRREDRPALRSFLCTVLAMSSPLVVSEVVAAGGAGVLEGWCAAARDDASKEAVGLLKELCAAMRAVPVDMAFLRGPGAGLSKAVGALRKHPNDAVKAAARDLVAAWLERAKAKEGGPAPARPSSQAPATASTRPSSTEQPAAKRVKTEGSAQEPTVGASAAAAQAARKTPAAAQSGSISFSDEDILKAAGRPAVRPGARAPAAPKVQVLSAAPTTSRVGAASPRTPPAAADASTSAGPAADSPRVAVALSVGADERVAVALAVAAPQGAATRQGGAVAAPRLGSVTGSSLALGVTRVGGLGSAARTGAAGGGGLAGIAGLLGSVAPLAPPAPTEPPRRARTNKRVSFVPDTKLEAVRWFKKTDPADQITRGDAFYTEEELWAAAQAAAQVGRAGFSAAARMEHQGERAALQQQHEVEAQEQRRMQDLVQRMHEQVPWYAPPPGVVGADWGLAAGEESSEAARMAEAPEPHWAPGLYPMDSPAEPQPREVLWPPPLRRICMTTEEATAIAPMEAAERSRWEAERARWEAQQAAQQAAEEATQQQQQQPAAPPANGDLLAVLASLGQVLGGGVPPPGSAPPAQAPQQPIQMQGAPLFAQPAPPPGQPGVYGAPAPPGHYLQPQPLQTGASAYLQQQPPPPRPMASLHGAPPGHPPYQQAQAWQPPPQQPPPQPHPQAPPQLYPLAPWIKPRACNFYAAPSGRGCTKGDTCDFLHIDPGTEHDVRQRRPPTAAPPPRPRGR